MSISQNIAIFAAMKEFSLLMSVYKGEKAEFLTMCFDSIAEQTLLPTEIILVEDGPLTLELYDAIAQEEKRFSNLKRVVLEKNQGLGIALNKGMQACSYDIIARMDTDDICMPTRFEKQVEYMEEHPDIDVLGAWITEFDNEPQNIAGIRSLPENHPDIFKFGKKRNPINHPVVMFRKQAVMSVGGYQSKKLFEDYFLWGRMLMAGCRFHNLQESLLLFRRSPEMIHRRGGFAYARYEIQLFQDLNRIGYVSKLQLVKNIAIRYIVRILPNCIRGGIYKHLLRKLP